MAKPAGEQIGSYRERVLPVEVKISYAAESSCGRSGSNGKSDPPVILMLKHG